MAQSIFTIPKFFEKIYGDKLPELESSYRTKFQSNFVTGLQSINALENVELIRPKTQGNKRRTTQPLTSVEREINSVPKEVAESLIGYTEIAAQLQLLLDNPKKQGTDKDSIFSEEDRDFDRIADHASKTIARIKSDPRVGKLTESIDNFEESNNIKIPEPTKNTFTNRAKNITDNIEEKLNSIKLEAEKQKKTRSKLDQVFEFFDRNPELSGLLLIGAATGVATGAAAIYTGGKALFSGGKALFGTGKTGTASKVAGTKMSSGAGLAPMLIGGLISSTKKKLSNLTSKSGAKSSVQGTPTNSAAIAGGVPTSTSAKDIATPDAVSTQQLPTGDTAEEHQKNSTSQKAERVRGASKLETLQIQSNEQLSSITTILESINTFAEKTFLLQEKMADSLAISAEAAQLKSEAKPNENLVLGSPKKETEETSSDTGADIEDIVDVGKLLRRGIRNFGRGRKLRKIRKTRAALGRGAKRATAEVVEDVAKATPKSIGALEGAAEGAAPGFLKSAARSVARRGTASKLLKAGKIGGLAGLASGLVDFGMRIRSGESVKSAAVGAGGSAVGGAVGAAVGQALIPIPILGAVIGGAVGSSIGDWTAKQITATEDSTNRIVAAQANTSHEIATAVTEPPRANQLPLEQEGQDSVLDRQLVELVSIREFMTTNMADFLEAIEVNTSDTTGGLFSLGRTLRSKPQEPKPETAATTGEQPPMQQVSTSTQTPILPASQLSTGVPPTEGFSQKTASMTKSRESVAGGSTHIGIQALSNRLAEDIPEIKQFTAFNDAFHQRRLQASKHKQGLAMDLTVDDPSKSSEVTAKIQKIISEAGINAFVQDEYKKQSAGATGGHIHIQLNNQGDANKLAMALVSPQPQLPSVRAENAGDAQQVARQSMTQAVNQNPATASAPQQNIVVAGGGSRSVVVPVSGGNRPPIGNVTDSTPIVQQLMGIRT